MQLDDPPSYSAEEPNFDDLLDPYLSGLGVPSDWSAGPFPNLRPATEDSHLNPVPFPAGILKEEIKDEPDFPPSPPPSSAGSTSSLTEMWTGDAGLRTHEEPKIMLESPPLSPPFDNSPPESPQEAVVSSMRVPTSPLASPASPGSEAVVKIIPAGLKFKLNKKVALPQRPAPFIKPKPSTESQPQLEAAVPPPVIKTALPTVKTVTLPTTVPTVGDKRKTIVLSAKDFAALTQKVRENQSACTIGLLNGIKGVPTTLRLQAQPSKTITPSTPAPTVVQTAATTAVPPIAVTASGQTSVSPFAQVLAPNSVPGKVPLIPCQTIPNSLPNVTTIPVSASSVRPLKSSSFSSPKAAQNPIRREMEMKALKRQQRMIKNRESACLSRKKKKEYVSSLEGRLTELEQENTQLKLENGALKDRLNELENAMTWTKAPSFSVKTKKATAILAVLLMVSLNLGSFSSLVNTNSDPLSVGNLGMGGSNMPDAVTHHGRSLLWAPTVDISLNDSSSSDYRTGNSSGSASVQPICPLYINQTESIRLDSELRRWIGSDPESPQDASGKGPWSSKSPIDSKGALHRDLSQGKPSEGKLPKALFNVSPMPPPNSVSTNDIKEKRAKLRRKSLANRASKKNPSASNAVEVYGVRSPLYDYTAFLDSFHRRDDTFYVVSFSGDHILLPAQAHNTSSRPKMSLVLPAVPLDKSMFGLNHIRMMQIDCEVTNTQMLRVRQDDIPAHLRPSAFEQFSNTSAEDGNTATANESSSASTRPSHSFHNSTPSAQNPATAAQPIYKPYFMKSGYPDRIPLSPQAHKLNAAFMKRKTVNAQNTNTNSTNAAQTKPTKLHYP